MPPRTFANAIAGTNAPLSRMPPRTFANAITGTNAPLSRMPPRTFANAITGTNSPLSHVVGPTFANALSATNVSPAHVDAGVGTEARPTYVNSGTSPPRYTDRETAMLRMLWRLAASDARLRRPLLEPQEAALALSAAPLVVNNSRLVDRALYGRAQQLARLRYPDNTNAFWTDQFMPRWEAMSGLGEDTDVSSLYDIREEIARRLAIKLGKIFVNVFINEHAPRADVRTEAVGVSSTATTVTVGGRKRYGEFYSVTQGSSVSRSYDAARHMVGRPNMGDILGTVRAGGSALVFGLGSSGAGKTYCLFGKQEEHTAGYVDMLLEQLREMGCVAKLKRVFELAGTIDAPELAGPTPWKGAVSGLVTPTLRDLTPFLIAEGEVHLMLDRVEEHRRTAATVNNPHSSRGHVFFVWEVVHPSTPDKRGLLTLVDMAGIEDATESVRQIIREVAVKTGKDLSGKRTEDRLYDVLHAIERIRHEDELRRRLRPPRPAVKPGQYGEVRTVGIEASAILSGWYHGERVHSYKSVAETLLQGLFIQQTLLDVSFYFQRRAGVMDAADGFKLVKARWDPPPAGGKARRPHYTRSSTFVDYTSPEYAPVGAPSLEALFRDFAKYRDRDPTGLVSVLKTIEAERTSGTDQTYCMLAVVNPMLAFGAEESIADTLAYAQSVSV